MIKPYVYYIIDHIDVRSERGTEQLLLMIRDDHFVPVSPFKSNVFASAGSASEENLDDSVHKHAPKSPKVHLFMH